MHDRSAAELVWSQQEVGLATTAERTFTYNYKPSEVSINPMMLQRFHHTSILTATVPCAQRVKNNGTLYSHVVFARSGVDLDTPSDELPPDSMFVKSHSKHQAAGFT